MNLRKNIFDKSSSSSQDVLLCIKVVDQASFFSF